MRLTLWKADKGVPFEVEYHGHVGVVYHLGSYADPGDRPTKIWAAQGPDGKDIVNDEGAEWFTTPGEALDELVRHLQEID